MCVHNKQVWRKALSLSLAKHSHTFCMNGALSSTPQTALSTRQDQTLAF